MAEFNSISFETNPYHNLIMKDRKYLEISGVKQIESFDEEMFIIETVQGYIEISGSELGLDKLDKERGEVHIKGMIEGIMYLDDRKSSKESFMRKMFR